MYHSSWGSRTHFHGPSSVLFCNKGTAAHVSNKVNNKGFQVFTAVVMKSTVVV
jgi:hypothetical protein